MKACKVTVKNYTYDCDDSYGWMRNDDERTLILMKEEQFIFSAEEVNKEERFFPRKEKPYDKINKAAFFLSECDCLYLYLLKDDEGVYLHAYTKVERVSNGR